MNPIAPGPSPDLDDAYWSKFNAWQFLQASVPKAREKPDWKAINTHPIARRLAHRGNPTNGWRSNPTNASLSSEVLESWLPPSLIVASLSPPEENITCEWLACHIA